MNTFGEQHKNIAWFLPRPKQDKYKGGMPLHCEKMLLSLARKLLDMVNPKVLNLFCGMNTEGFRVDIKKEVNPDLVCDVHELTKHHNNLYDIILADPPYSNVESKDLYNTGKLHYNTWTAEASKLLYNGGLLIIYHKYIMPNPDPEQFYILKRVFIGNRTYHTPRAALYFQKKKGYLPLGKDTVRFERYTMSGEDL